MRQVEEEGNVGRKVCARQGKVELRRRNYDSCGWVKGNPVRWTLVDVCMSQSDRN
jgi:hypothetical protein